MTRKEFMTLCEEYYGEKYEGVRFAVMDGYLEKKSALFFDCAAVVLTKRFSRANKIAPGPAEIEKHLDEIIECIQGKKIPETREQLTDEEREEMRGKLHWLAEKLKSGSLTEPVRS